ncbi:MAG TPA: hypothetical protein DCM07_15165, partial [Planctomycetaceae bacterium]|nr:hypothetical protein [Planctomycetaceae bacterium]
MTEQTEFRELTAEEVTLKLDPKSFGFKSTQELEPLTEIVGQPRVVRALELGTGIRHPNYHIYLSGLVGTGRNELITHALRERILDDSIPDDWIYVNNFDEPDSPLAISLPAGQGIQFRTEMESLIEQLQESLPKAFKEEDFGNEKEKLRQIYRKRGEEVFDKLQKQAGQHELTVQQMPNGEILFIPLKDNRPMTQEEIEKLTPEEMQELESHQDELVGMAGRVLQEQREIQRQLSVDVREVARRFAIQIVDPLVNELQQKFKSPKLKDWLSHFKNHVINHLNLFRDTADMPPQAAALLAAEGGADPELRFMDYRVNVVVDNSHLKEPPIIVEDAPNYRNLFGTIERVVDRAGRVITNFTRIKAGSLLKANGGYLILNLMDALIEPFVWKELKRTLKNQSLEIQIQDH